MAYVFYGAALQGSRDRSERAHIHSEFINHLKSIGFSVKTEHTISKNREQAHRLLEESIGPLPPEGLERTRYIRDKMVEAVESDIEAAVFEVSCPSLGTGVEVAHAYLRPRMGLKTVPVIALYQRDYWPNKLSTMLLGIGESVPHFKIIEYTGIEDAKDALTRELG